MGCCLDGFKIKEARKKSENKREREMLMVAGGRLLSDGLMLVIETSRINIH